MALKFSTGLRNGMLASSPLAGLLPAGEIRIYSGIPPATADTALNGNDLLVTIRAAGAAVTWNPTASGGVLSKASGEVWSGTVALSGLATFYRHVLLADTGTLSTTAPRIQGTIGVAGADMNLTNPQLVSSATQGISAYSVALPEA